MRNFLPDEELQRRVGQLKRGYYGAFLEFAGVSKEYARTIRMRIDTITDLTRERLTKAFAAMDAGEIEFRLQDKPNPSKRGKKRLVACRKTMEGKVVSGGNLVYPQQLMREIGAVQTNDFKNISLPPLPVRVRQTAR